MLHRQKIITKSENWQLYDKSNDEPVTLDELRKMIVAGTELLVIDDSSGADITVESLQHIIMEKEKSLQSQYGVLLA